MSRRDFVQIFIINKFRLDSTPSFNFFIFDKTIQQESFHIFTHFIHPL